MRNNPIFTTAAAIAAIVGCGFAPLLAGCGSSHSTVSPVETATTPSLETLRSAPAIVTVGSLKLSMTAVLFRNLMPTVGTGNNSALSGSVTITPQGGSQIPAGFAITAAYAVESNSSGVFTLTTPVVPTTNTVSSVQASIANGPSLEAGTVTDVVVSFHDAAGNTYLLKSTGVQIAAVY